MDYKTIRDRIEDMAKDNHKNFVKAVISMEKGINDESALDKLYDAYMANDTINLLHEDFDYMIEDLREQGQIKDLPYVQQEKDNLVNIVGNIVGKVDIIERENKNGEAFKVANFSVVSKDDEGNKIYHNCSAYGEKSDIPKDFKQGDFVKLFGQIRTSIDDNGKEHTNIRILSSKLLKAKEQMKGQDKSQEIAKLKSEIEEREKDLFYADSWEQSGQIRADIEKMNAKLNTLLNSEKGQENGKKSILGAIKEYQAEDKQKPKESKEKPKETERSLWIAIHDNRFITSCLNSFYRMDGRIVKLDPLPDSDRTRTQHQN